MRLFLLASAIQQAFAVYPHIFPVLIETSNARLSVEISGNI